MNSTQEINQMYSRKSGLIVGFHGCDETVRDAIVSGKIDQLKASENDYDWLGSGVYFWENNYERALQYANDLKKFSKKAIRPITKPTVVGAVIDLGYCLDLMETYYLDSLKSVYTILESSYQTEELPKNETIGKSKDLLLRRLDCAVVEALHEFNATNDFPSFDSVQGVFFEGNDLYPNAGFKEKNHIQIAIRNPNCIKGYFLPKEPNKLYTIP